DVPTSAIPISEPIDLIKSEYKPPDTDKQNASFSPGMRLLLNQTLLEMMGGNLEIVSSVSDKANEHFSRLQVSIPLMIPEAGFLESA
ncbi:MAG: sensor histidine kinase, partial [Tolypothrix sp. T3-bin4]|nr:sensor histidine kinase [Tolypothrix sp. T3-bin4]